MTSVSSAASGHEAVAAAVKPERQRLGSLLIRVSTLLLGLFILVETLYAFGIISI